ncbi:MAG: hypothetical protein IBJ11_10615, partial [Phycisphaerales bacterium]|nr:hypothetical protein [Phycisphaerales bacterium]
MKTRTTRAAAAAAALLAAAGAASAQRYTGTTGTGSLPATATAAAEAGNFLLSRPSTVVYGSESPISTNIRVPVVLDTADSSINSAFVQNLSGTFVGIVNNFRNGATGNDPQQRGWVMGFSAVPSGGFPQGNNNLINDYGVLPATAAITNTAGALLTDGTALFRTSFISGTRNNVQFIPGVLGLATSPFPPANTGAPVNAFTGPLVDSTPGTGGVFLANPSAIRAANGDLLITQSSWDGVSNGVPVGPVSQGVNVFRYAGAPADIQTPAFQWPQGKFPVPYFGSGGSGTVTSANAETYSDYRIGAARLFTVTRNGDTRTYVFTGLGADTGSAGNAPAAGSLGTPFFGGSTRLLYLFVDELNSAAAAGNGFSDGLNAVIPADPAGVYDATPVSPEIPDPISINPFSLNPTVGSGGSVGLTAPGGNTAFGPSYRFLSRQANGGTDANAGQRFGANSKGQLIVIRENRSNFSSVDTGPAASHQILLYNPIFSNNPGEGAKIIGYSAPTVIVDTSVTYNLPGGGTLKLAQAPLDRWTGVTGASGTITRAAAVTGGYLYRDTVVPFGGVGIDDDGNVAFTAATTVVNGTGNVTLAGSGTSPAASGSTFVSRVGASSLFVYKASTATLHQLVTGGDNNDVIPNTVNATRTLNVGNFPVDAGASDCFTADGLSATGGAMAVAFRAGSVVSATNVGGRLNGPNQFVRGVLLVNADLTPPVVAPGAFSLTGPTANQLIAKLPVPTSRNPTITWTASAGADTYTVQITTPADTGFTTPIVNQTGLTGTSWVVTTNLNYATKYLARVRAVNTGGTTTATPASVLFGIKCQADVDNNGSVAANDLSLLLGAFGGGAGGPADVDGVGG